MGQEATRYRIFGAFKSDLLAFFKRRVALEELFAHVTSRLVRTVGGTGISLRRTGLPLREWDAEQEVAPPPVRPAEFCIESPIRCEEDLWGVFVLRFASPPDPDLQQDAADLLRFVTLSVGYYLENSLHRQRQRKSLERQKVVNKALSAIFLEGRTFESALRRMLDLLADYLRDGRGYAIRLETGKGAEIVATTTNYRADFLKDLDKIDVQGLMESVLFCSQDHVEVVDHLGERTIGVSAWDRLVRPFGVKSCVISPILVGRQVWGFFVIAFSRDEVGLTAVDRDVFEVYRHALRMLLERDRLQRALEDERDAALAAEKSKDAFFSSVSHDIRTPLNAIMGYAELLQDGWGTLPKDQVGEYVRNITFSGNVLLELVNNVLDIAKFDMGKMSVSLADVDLGEMIARVCGTFGQSVKTVGIALRTEVPELPGLRLDGGKLKQVLFNLVGNAVKFTQRGQVTVSATFARGVDQTGELRIVVRDTGVGMSPENLARLGQPFVRFENGLVTDGSGLGYMNCRQLMNVMGGRLEAESTLGEGSAFTIVLPGVPFRERPKPAVEAPVPEAQQEAVVPAGVSVLFVDDSPLNLKVSVALCRVLGVTDVQTAESAAAALKALETRPVNVVITDIQMPERDGYGLLADIRARPEFAKVRVYAFTADLSAREKLASHAFDGCLFKPLNRDRLRGVLTGKA